MKKLVLSLAGSALLAGLGGAYAATPLTAASMDKITAAGEQTSCDQNYSRDSHHYNHGDRTSQKNVSFLSPQVNIAPQTNVSPNVSVVNLGYNHQNTSNYQSSSQSNFNGNISR